MRMRLIYFLVGLALVLCGIGIRIADPYPLPQIRSAYFDILQRMDPRKPQNFPLRIVAIDEASLQSEGQWPWPRSKLTQLNEQLSAYGAAIVVYDVLFAEEDRYSLSRLIADTEFGPALNQALGPSAAEFFDNDLTFATSFASIPTVLGSSVSTSESSTFAFNKAGFVTIGNPVDDAIWSPSALTPVIPILRDSAEGIGVINVSPDDKSGVVRRVPLVWKHEDRLVPSLGLEALRAAIGESTYFLNSSLDVDGVVESVRVGDFTFPTTSNGEFWVRYRPETEETYVSATDVLQETFDPALSEKLHGHIVFVGATASGLYDIRTTALGEKVPGVSVHLQILEQVFAKDFLIRTDYQDGIEILIFALLGLVVTMAITIKNSIVTVIAGLGSASVIVVTSYLGFTRMGVLVDISFPLIGGMVNFAILSGYQFIVADRDKRALRKSFAHYVAPGVLEEIEQSGYDIRLGGETKDVTVMFADIRGFTAYSESRDPTEVVAALNDLFTRLSVPILEQNGTIDKFIGDSIMALWGAPMAVQDHAKRGLRSALDFRRALLEFNKGQHEKEQPELSIAVGFATGPACVGNIGSNQRFSYSAIGGTVNLAARVEGACRPIGYDIVATTTTADASGFACLTAGHEALKGISQPLELSIVVGDEAMAASKEFSELNEAHSELAKLLSEPEIATGPIQSAVGTCVSLAESVEPGLLTFYANIESRRTAFQIVQAIDHANLTPSA